MKRFLFLVIIMTIVPLLPHAKACTGITLQTADGDVITARTIEWAYTPLNAIYVAVPRGQQLTSLLSDANGEKRRWDANYGYVGIAVENSSYVMEGINEAGLNAGLFYFPNYGKYPPYETNTEHLYVADMQFVSWVLSSFSTIDELLEGLAMVRVVGADPRASTAHWRVTEPSGRQVVLEVVNEEMKVYENPLGVLTNSPELPWHLTNLNNYVNLIPGSVATQSLGKMQLNAFGGGSGMLGLPGDMTSPSRFVRAAFYQNTAPRLNSTEQTVMQAFHLLNQFDIPIGVQFSDPKMAPDMPSATQITIVTDLKNSRLYYRTMYNSAIRCFNLQDVNFDNLMFVAAPLEECYKESIHSIEID